MKLQELIDITDELYYVYSTSYKVIRSKQKELLEVIGADTDVKDITREYINKYIQYLQNKGNSNATINAKLAYLSKLLTYAYQNEIINHKPYIPLLKVKVTKEKYLSKLEKTQILYWCWRNNQRELAKIILIGLYTGLRINNILSLTDKNYIDDVLQIYDKKVNKYFTMPVSPKIEYIIKHHKKFNLTYRQCYYLFSIIKQDLKLDKAITIHTLRHTFCSDLVQKGVALPIIKTLANHKKIQTTMRYTHLDTKQLKDAVGIL